MAFATEDETGSSGGKSSIAETPRRAVEIDDAPRTLASGSRKSAVTLEFEDWEMKLAGDGSVTMPDKSD